VDDAQHFLTSQFLAWVMARPRCYGEVMDAWRTSCPRLPVWEAAVDLGLVEVQYRPGLSMTDCPVILTPAGRQAVAVPPVSP
jgi:hypothetical protein